jgi:hypothetical protein
VTNGLYCIEIFSPNGMNGEDVLTKNVMVVDNGRGGLGVLAYPNPWRGEEAPLTFQCSSTQPLTLKVLLYDLAGELVAVLEGPPGANQAFLENKIFASGIYVAVVELRDGNGNLAGRQTLKVLIEH